MKPTASNGTGSAYYALLVLILLISTLKSYSQLHADFSADIRSGCPPIVVHFSDLSTGNPGEWKWDLGNGTISALQNPSVTYFTAGTYTVRLTVKKTNQSDSVIKTGYIRVFETPTADFTASVSSGCTPFPVQFNPSISSGNNSAASTTWDFGDGSISSNSTPLHTYTIAGDLSVMLKVVNSDGCATTVKKSNLIKSHSVKSSFTHLTSGACSSNKLLFQQTAVAGGPVSYAWDFGDSTTAATANPAHTFNKGGVYRVMLKVIDQYGCTDTFSKSIQVMDRANASFSSDKRIICGNNGSIHFSNASLYGCTYQWNFGDYTNSTASNPVHNYTDTGTYHVTLVVTNFNGCRDTLTKNNYIRAIKTYVDPAALPDSGCIGYEKKFLTDVYSNDNITGYLWKFGDGGTSTQPMPSHIYTSTGLYDVTLITTTQSGCIDTTLFPSSIQISTKPTANFSVNAAVSCAGTALSFTDLSAGGANSWQWMFGDDEMSTDQSPSHHFADTGWMTITLIAMHGGCADMITKNNYVYIKPALAKFKIEAACGEPYKRTFNNISLGAERWEWDFGDGTRSTQWSPEHTYAQQGTYEVRLSVWNDSTGCSHIKSKKIKIIDFVPAFMSADTVSCSGAAVKLYADSSSGNISRYIWDFGDSVRTFSPRSNVAHQYLTPGTYSVTLITVDSINCKDTLVKINYINITQPQAAFGISNNPACINMPVTFTDSSTAQNSNPIVKWKFSFGDGNSGIFTAPPFTHSYTRNGSYNIHLDITDSKGCTDSLTYPVKLQVKPVYATLMSNDTLVCPGFPVKFICSFAEPGTSYYWDFGDGETASIQMPRHIYRQNGIYTVKLVVRNANGCSDSTIKTNFIKVKQTVARFNISDSFQACPPLLIHFTNQAEGALSTSWNFGDSSFTSSSDASHYYTYPGIYRATLYAKGPAGCEDSTYKTIVVKGPRGSIRYQPSQQCGPYRVNLSATTQNAISYVWDMNDGTTIAGTDSTIQYEYLTPGKYLPRIIITDSTGCKVPVTGKDTIYNNFIHAGFTLSDSFYCKGSIVRFTNTSSYNDSIATIRWNFGDATLSDSLHPSHRYLTPGSYRPSLQITTVHGCSSSFTYPHAITIAAPPVFSISGPANGCAPLLAQWQVSAQDSILNNGQWQWELSNGQSFSGTSTPAIYLQDAGVYTIKLTGTGMGGCSTAIKDTTEAFASPDIKIIGNDNICRGNSTTLMATGAAHYKWSSTNAISCDTCSSINIQPLNSVSYIVSAVAVTGCSGRDSVHIHVNQPFKLNLQRQQFTCKGKSKNLSVSGAATYNWSPVTGLSDPESSNPVAHTDSSITYHVTGYDTSGCFTDTASIQLTVMSNPTVDAGSDKAIVAGEEVVLEATYSRDVTDVFWSPNDNVSRYSPGSILVKPVQNTEYSVEVRNAGGCSAFDKVNVKVNCTGKNIFVPNLFSPNSDGVNDIFYPRGKGIERIVSIRIFSRWGEMIFEKKNFMANDPSAGWNGTYKGMLLPPDTFVYIMEVTCENGSIITSNGNITLAR